MRKASMNGLIVTFKEYSAKGYALKLMFKRKFSDEIEAITSKQAWENGCLKAVISLRGEVI